MTKAGSTALQDSLLRSRDRLLEKGVLYPLNVDGVAFNNHRLLVAPLLDFDKLPSSIRKVCSGPEDAWRKYEDMIATIRRQVRETKPSCVILSAEHVLRTLSGDGGPRLRRELARLRLGRVEVVVYVRRPSAWYLSGLQQSLKADGKFRRPSVSESTRTLRACADLFGRSAVRVRMFDRETLSGGSITTDFAETYLQAERVTPQDLIDPVKTNDSLSTASMELLDRYRQDRLAGTECGFTLSTLRNALDDVERTLDLPRPMLKQSVADSLDYASTDPLWLRDTHGVVFTDFDYARLERGDLAPPPTQEALSEVLDQRGMNIGRIAKRVAKRHPDTALGTWMTRFAPDTPPKSGSDDDPNL